MAKHSFVCNGCIYLDSTTNIELDAEKCENCNGQGKEWQPRNTEFYEKDPQKFMEYLLLGSNINNILATNKEDDLWYKLCVYYHAQTELFDRTLTDLRSPHDPTEAYIDGRVRKYSNAHAVKTRNFVLSVQKELNIPLLAEDTGENYGRTVVFNPENGDYYIKAIGREPKWI